MEPTGAMVSDGLVLEKALHGHAAAISRAVWAPGGEQMVTASVDNTLRIWDYASEDDYFHLLGDAKGFTDFDITSEGGHVVTASWNDADLEVWQLDKAVKLHTLNGHTAPVQSVRISPDNWHILSVANDHKAMVWQLETGKLERVLDAHRNFVLSCAFTLDSRFAITGGADNMIIIWDLWDEDAPPRRLQGHTGPVHSLALSSDGRMLASGSADQTIRIWDLENDTFMRMLIGHTNTVNTLDFSTGDKFLASKSMDGTIRLWRCDIWEEVTRQAEPVFSGLGYFPNGLAFHPTQPLLMSLGEKDEVLRIWRLDYPKLIDTPATNAIYGSVKIALVGESDIGKTSIRHQLTAKKGNLVANKHYTVKAIDELAATGSETVHGEAFVWDFEGGHGHHWVHPTLLSDVDIAVLLFSAMDWNDPLQQLEYWVRQLGYRNDLRQMTLILGIIHDEGVRPSNIMPGDWQDFCRLHNIEETVMLVPKTGEGIPELQNVLAAALDWGAVNTMVNENLFRQTRDYIYERTSGAQQFGLFVSLSDLQAHLDASEAGWEYTDAQMMLAVSHLEKQGHIMLIDAIDGGDATILLKPELLIELCSAILSEARRNPRGLGAISSDSLYNGQIQFPILQPLTLAEQQTLLAAALDLLREHEIFFDEQVDGRHLLIFPGLMSQKRPVSKQPHLEENTAFHVTGKVTHIYHALVVWLNENNLFVRNYQWDDYAQFETGTTEIVGLQKIDLAPNVIEIVLYSMAGIPDFTLKIFFGLVERILRAHDVSVQTFPSLKCPNCGRIQTRNDIIKLSTEGFDSIYCVQCGTRIIIGEDAAQDKPLASSQNATTLPERIPFTDPPSRPKPPSMGFQNSHLWEALVKLRDHYFKREDFKPISCFISYAWGVPEHEYWVNRLAENLRSVGIEVSMDSWQNPNFGGDENDLIRQIEDAGYILIIGSHMYRHKYTARDTSMGTVVEDEIDIIAARLDGDDTARATVLPLLLEGTREDSLPPILHKAIVNDLRQERFYFMRLYALVAMMYRGGSDAPYMGGLGAKP